MFNSNRRAHDAFRFSLGGMTTKSPFFGTPAFADSLPDRVRERRLDQARGDRSDAAREVEDVLAHYFAPGRCRAA